MSVIESRISNRNAEFQQNRDAMVLLVDDLNAKVAAIAEGGVNARAQNISIAANCYRVNGLSA